MLDINSLKTIITNIVRTEIDKSIKELKKEIPNIVKEELKNYLFDKFVENNRNQSYLNEGYRSQPDDYQQKPQPKSDRVSLKELLDDSRSVYNQELNRPQMPVRNGPRINTHNQKLNNILQDMVNKGYDPIPAEGAMNPIASYAMQECDSPYINNTGLYGNINPKDMYQGSAGPGIIANSSPDEIVIK